VLRERLSHMPCGWEGQHADLADIALLREARTHEMIAKFDRPAGYDSAAPCMSGTRPEPRHGDAAGGAGACEPSSLTSR
jgi:hypothetical protein